MEPGLVAAASALAAAAGFLRRSQSAATTQAWKTAAVQLRGRYDRCASAGVGLAEAR
jgi:hypothetical protein